MSLLLGILIAGLALLLALVVCWVRWQVRDRRVRQRRLAERRRQDELDRAAIADITQAAMRRLVKLERRG